MARDRRKARPTVFPSTPQLQHGFVEPQLGGSATIGDDRRDPFNEADYRKAAQDGGFAGNIIVGTDLESVQLPAK